MRTRITSLIAGLAVAAGGCGEEAVPSVVQWIDGTGSAAGDSIELCTNNAREITRAAAAKNASVAVERLDATTANAPTWKHRKRFAIPAEIAADPETIDDEHAKNIEELYNSARAVLAAPAAGHTEIIGALDASGRRLRDHDGPRFIHACTDLLDRRLLALDHLDQQSVEKLFEAMRRSGDIPRLHGAKVAFDTTSAEALDGLGPREHAAIEWFYKAVVEEGGGELVAHGPGAALPLG